AKKFILENAAGAPTLTSRRRINAESQIEQVGSKLRAMMPWIAANKLVDKSNNRSSHLWWLTPFAVRDSGTFPARQAVATVPDSRRVSDTFAVRDSGTFPARQVVPTVSDSRRVSDTSPA